MRELAGVLQQVGRLAIRRPGTALRASSPLIAVLVLLAACDGEVPAGDPPASAPELTPSGATAVPEATARHFDPGVLAPGDTFLGLRVVERDARRVFEDSVWAGRVRFAGEVTVSGEYARHFDWPEPDALCFHVTDASSVGRIPAFAPDTWTSPNARTWFCFTNPGRAVELLGDGAVPVNATVVVDDYLVVREFSDVLATARLVDVVAAAPPPD